MGMWDVELRRHGTWSDGDTGQELNMGHGAWSEGDLGDGVVRMWDMSEGDVRVIGAWSDGHMGCGVHVQHEVTGM